MFKYIVFIIIIFFCITSQSNAKESLTLKQQLDRLQRDINDLSKIVYSDSSNTEITKSEKLSEPTDLTAFDFRIYELEKDIKKINANFEELIFQIDDLKKLYQDLTLNMNSQLLNSKKNLINENNTNIINDDKDSGINTEKNTLNNENNSLGSLIISSEDLSYQSDEIDSDVKNSTQIELNLSPEEEFQIAFDLLRSQQFDEAKIALKKFIENYNENKLAGAAHYWLGEIYILKKEYREAALVLAEGYQKFPKSIKAPNMLYKLSESLIMIDKKNDSCNTLKKITLEFPKNKLIVKTLDKMNSLGCNSLIE